MVETTVRHEPQSIVASAQFDFDAPAEALAQNAALADLLKKAGLSAQDFLHLIHEEIEPERPPEDEVLTMGDIQEDVTTSDVKVGERIIEIAHARRSAPQTQPAIVEMQLHQEEEPSYKLLVGLAGEAVIHTMRVEPMGQIYGAEKDSQELPMTRGTVISIPAGEGWTMASGSADLDYLYISTPPHNSRGDVIVEARVV